MFYKVFNVAPTEINDSKRKEIIMDKMQNGFDSVSFVNELVLPAMEAVPFASERKIPKSDELLTAENQPSAYLDGEMLISFAANVSFQLRQDVLNSALLAQLAAFKNHDIDADPIRWYEEYQKTLRNIGWVIQNSAFEKYALSSQRVSIDEVVIKLLTAILSGNDLEIVKSALVAAKALEGKDKRLTLFERGSKSGNVGGFQIAMCTEVNGAVTIKTLAFKMSLSDNCVNVLWAKYDSSNSAIEKRLQVSTLNTGTYNTVRDAIVGKLGQKAQSFIDQLDI